MEAIAQIMRYPNLPISAVLGIGLALSLLTACPSQPLATGAIPQASSSPSELPGVSVSPGPQSGELENPVPAESALPGASPLPSASSSPAGGGSATIKLPENLSSIRFASVDRFLDQQGETTHIRVELLDQLGQLIPINVPFAWTSSRSQDFSVDAEGNVTALVEFGYSTIEARIPGTSFRASSVINVNSADSGSGGSAAGRIAVPVIVNAAPVIQSLQASQTTVVGAGTLVKLTASATDADSTLTPASYNWSCADAACANQFETSTGTSVYWRSPAMAGAYALNLIVSDGQASTTQSVSITVQTGQGQLQVNPLI